jgi:hypothetical protein
MKRFVPLLFIATLAALAVSCSQRNFQNTLEIESRTIPGIDFRQYHNWKFAREEEYPLTNIPVLDDPGFRQSIGLSMIEDMNKLGYAKVDSLPDFVMMIHVVVEDKFDQQKMNDIYQGYDMAWAQMNADDYWKEGQLLLFAMDAKTGKQIWSAAAHARLDKEPAKAETTKKRIKSIISSMLEDFPRAMK